MNEIMSIPTGMLACDAMLKAAQVELVSAGCICAGKYYIVVTGEVAAVRASVEAGREAAQGLLIDSMVIPNVDPQVAPAISACTEVDRGLGGKSFILLTGEVAAVRAAIEAAEALEETKGLMAQSAVIPSPHPDMLRAIG